MIEHITLLPAQFQRIQFAAGVEPEPGEHVDFPLRMAGADQIGKTIFNAFDAVPGAKGIAQETDAPQSRLGSGRVFNVVPKPGHIVDDIPLHPTLRDVRISQGIGGIVDVSVIKFAPQSGKHNQDEAGKQIDQ